MKAILIFLLLTITSFASAEICTSVIKDRRGYEWETFTRSSYSRQAACDQASYDCSGALSYGQSQGRYYDAFCEIKFEAPNPYPFPLICQTDLVDFMGRTYSSFNAEGVNEWDACNLSNNLCSEALAKMGNFGFRCENKGIINRNDPRSTTEQCIVNRQDAFGRLIQGYFGVATGSVNTDVRGEACKSALNLCLRDLGNRQFCNIVPKI